MELKKWLVTVEWYSEQNKQVIHMRYFVREIPILQGIIIIYSVMD